MKNSKNDNKNSVFKKTKNPELVQKQRRSIINFYVNKRKEQEENSRKK